ncbi:MAG: methionyl-tRNA formyltransferase [Simkania negevensis]|nr:methionyl-tRNA formyltransferase [Simkania negevensis]
MRIIFFGTPPFAAKILSHLIKRKINIVAVVTKPDRPKGRSSLPSFSAVKEEVLHFHSTLPLHQPEKASTHSFATLLAFYQPDLFVVVAYGEIMKQDLLDIPKCGAINLHASLLPKYRGASPMQWALLEGEKETGVTIIEMVLKMDAGDVLKQKKIPLSEEMNLGELEEKMIPVGSEALLEVIEEYKNGKVKKVLQEHEKATYVSKITPELLHIRWDKTALEIHNQVRAFSPLPGAFCEIQVGSHIKRLKIFRSKVESTLLPHDASPGATLHYDSQGWTIACKGGSLRLLEVQLEGKKKMGIEEFVRGVSLPLLCVPKKD